MNCAKQCVISLLVTFVLMVVRAPADSIDDVLKRTGINRGIVALIGVPNDSADHAVDIANNSELTLYIQTADKNLANRIREQAAEAKLLGNRIFVAHALFNTVHLADNVADCILVAPSAEGKTLDNELLRVVRPRAMVFVGDRELVKPVPHGIDEWTHPYHGPDNNPQSNDQLVRGSFRTQFLGFPKFSPMPEQTVIAGGRIYKAMGHIAHKANQNEILNTLLCINAYNGTILWQRPLSPGFMMHRNTMIATGDALYMGDHESCKIIDAETGEVRDQITVPQELTDGPVWKWMAMRNRQLIGLVGNPEIQVDTQRSAQRGLGHWPWGMWKGHDYKDPRTAFGFGRTVVAIDPNSKSVLWHYRDEEFLDARAVCMNSDQIFCYCPQKFLACINAKDGTLIWKNSDKELLDAIAPNGRAQHYITGYSTTCYMKCTDDHVFFAGPQREKLVAASTADGKLAWTHPEGNLQLVLRDDAIWAAGPQKSNNGVRLDYATGKVLDEFPARRACTRATGCADSIFFRASGGTVRVLTESNTAQHIDPMRPPCQDGVIISNGHLYWGPWMCGCQLSLYGNIALAPSVNPHNETEDVYHDALTVGKNIEAVESLGARSGDWTSYLGNNARSGVIAGEIPADVKLAWKTQIPSGELPTAPIAAGGMSFVADRAGAVRAFDENGELVWKQYTAGPVYYPPAVADDRVYVGSADGRVYAYEATTGRFLWSFRVAPRERMIPIYGKLISSWPVSGGVVVENRTVYAAAGISHYDGTYVVALDAITGKIKAQNMTSGQLSAEVDNGISLQGNLSIADGQLQFLAGGVYELASYDLNTLECLNTSKVQVNSQFRTAFYPFYPAYGKYLSIDHTYDDGTSLIHHASYEGSKFTNLALHEPLPPGTTRPREEAARWILRRGGTPPKVLWQDQAARRFTSFILSDEHLLATGHPDANPDESFLVAVNIKDGSDAWIRPISANAVKGGAAIDHAGRLYISLENGELLCFVPTEG